MQRQFMPTTPNMMAPKTFSSKIFDTLCESKLFVNRLYRPVTLLQALVRGYLQRERFQILYNNYLVERQLQQEEVRRQQVLARQGRAIVPVQALLRGVWGRRAAHLMRLERQLELIEARKLSDLEAVDEWKARERATIDELYDIKATEYSELEARAQQVPRLVKALRSQNKELRSVGDDLRSEISELKDMNHQLAMKTHALQVLITKTKADIAAQEKANVQWNQVVVMFEERIEQYETILGETSEMIAVERKTSVLLETMMATVFSRLKDLGDLNLMGECVAAAKGEEWDPTPVVGPEPSSPSKSPSKRRHKAVAV